MEEIGLNSLEKMISSNRACLVYFYTNHCAPCAELRPKVKNLLKVKYKLMRSVFIAADESNELTSSFNVFSSPTIILFFEGKETRRFGKFVSISEMDESIDRYYSLIFD